LPIGPDVSNAPAAGSTDEARLDIGQPDVVGPVVGGKRVEWLQR
jgi:hypothetical protein